MPGAVIVRSMPNERYCVLGLKANETETAGTKSSVQEFLDVPCVVDHGRFGQPLIVQQVAPESFRQTFYCRSRN